MLRNRLPLNPEHQASQLPIGGMIRKRVKRLFMILMALLITQVFIIWGPKS